MSSHNPNQEVIFNPEEAIAVPIGLRAEGLSKVLGYYDSINRTNVGQTHARLGKVATDVFAKTFGVRELIGAGTDEETAVEMANDYYFGRNNTGYNPEGKSFLQSYIGKTNKPARKSFQQVLEPEITAFSRQAEFKAEQPVSPTVRTELNEGRVILPRHAQVVQAASYKGVAGEDRITLGRLIKLAGEGIYEPWQHEEPAISFINQGLYIHPQDPRFARAQLLVRSGVDLQSNDPKNFGVVFPPEEFRTVARSPRDLVRHMQAVTRRANETNEDPDDVAERTGRSAGHVLTEKMAAMAALSGTLEGRQAFLRKMYKELRSPWIAHYMSKNLERHRGSVDEMIHDTADLATVNLNLCSEALKRMHVGVKKKLYGGNRTHDEISKEWQAYITLVGRHIGMRLLKVDASVRLCEVELSTYQPYLDRKQQAA
jgi:hypothetical protein